MGDGLHRPLFGSGPRFQRSLLCSDRSFGVGTPGVPVSDWRSVQSVWDLLECFGMGAAYHQLCFLGAYLHSHLLHRESTFWRTRRALVGLDLGAVALHVVLVDSLGVGHHHLAISAGVHLPGESQAGRLAGDQRLAALRCSLGSRRAGEPVSALVPSCWWALGLVPAIDKGIGFGCGDSGGFGNLLLLSCSVADT